MHQIHWLQGLFFPWNQHQFGHLKMDEKGRLFRLPLGKWKNLLFSFREAMIKPIGSIGTGIFTIHLPTFTVILMGFHVDNYTLHGCYGMGFPCQFEGVVHPCVAKQVLLCQGSGRSLEVPRERDVLERLRINCTFFFEKCWITTSKIHTFYISLWYIDYNVLSVYQRMMLMMVVIVIIIMIMMATPWISCSPSFHYNRFCNQRFLPSAFLQPDPRRGLQRRPDLPRLQRCGGLKTS